VELIEPKVPLLAHGCCGVLYKYLNTVEKRDLKHLESFWAVAVFAF